MKKKIIITAAVTGAVHTPGMSPYLPITPDDIASHAIDACKAGAAAVHLHARIPTTGRPSSDINIYKEMVAKIKKETDGIICITTGGALGMQLDERLKPVTVLKPELASCNAGSVNFVLTPATRKLKPKYDWEIPFLKGTEDLIFSNTYKGIKYYIETMNDTGTLPEFEVYDVAMINNIAYFKRTGVITQPIYIQFVLGILGGIPAEVENLVFMVNTAKKLLGNDFNWSVAAAGKNQFKMATVAMALGGNIRVGLEDNLYLKPGVLAKNSAEQVTLVREILERLGMEIAKPEEARKILGI